MAIVGVSTYKSWSGTAQILEYIADPGKTMPAMPPEVLQMDPELVPLLYERYVTGLNLIRPESAAREFLATQNRWDQARFTRGIHVINGFAPGDPAPAQLVHEVGLELAKRLFPGHEVLAATHLNRPHLHTHIVANPVSVETGKRFAVPRERLFFDCPVFAEAQRVLNEVHISFGLEPIIYPAGPQGNWKDRHFRSPAREQISQDVRAACAVSKNVAEMTEVLRSIGYEIREEDGIIRMRPPGKRNFWYIRKLFHPWELKVMTEDGAMREVRREEKRKMNTYLRPFSPDDTIGGKVTVFEARILYWLQSLKKYNRVEAADLSQKVPGLATGSKLEMRRILAAFRAVRRCALATPEEAQEHIDALCAERSAYTAKIRDLRKGIVPEGSEAQNPKVLLAELEEKRRTAVREINALRRAVKAAEAGVAFREAEGEMTRDKDRQYAYER